jgi:hypothetical protein
MPRWRAVAKMDFLMFWTVNKVFKLLDQLGKLLSVVDSPHSLCEKGSQERLDFVLSIGTGTKREKTKIGPQSPAKLSPLLNQKSN